MDNIMNEFKSIIAEMWYQTLTDCYLFTYKSPNTINRYRVEMELRNSSIGLTLLNLRYRILDKLDE